MLGQRIVCASELAIIHETAFRWWVDGGTRLYIGWAPRVKSSKFGPVNSDIHLQTAVSSGFSLFAQFIIFSNDKNMKQTRSLSEFS